MLRILSVVALFATTLSDGLLGQTPINGADLVGAWQVIAAKNMQTGTVDTLTKHRLHWIIFTPTHRVSIAGESGRKMAKAADVAAMSVDKRVQTRYSEAWGPEGQQLFAANAGLYRVRGNVIEYTYAVALATDSGTTAKYTVTSLNGSTLVYRNEPNPRGEVIELTLRRVN